MLDIVAGVPELEVGVGPSRPVRVAIVGLGRMGVAHAAVLSMLPGTSVVGAVDSQRGAARRLHGMGFRVPVAPTLDALFAGTPVDAVWVCTPPDSHLPVAGRCLEAGAAVFVEKPLAQSLDDARALAALAAASPDPVACGYTLAFWPSFAAARWLLRAGVIGAPARAISSMVMSQVSGPQRGWMYDRARSGGGVVANLSSHLLFLLRWYFGMPTSVRATWRQVHTAVDDEVQATLVAPDCAEIVFESSWCVPGYPTSATSLAIEGANGTLRVDNDAVRLDLHSPHCGLPSGRTTIGEADMPQPAGFAFNGEAYTLEDAHVLRWVTGGPEPPITAAAGLEVQAIIEALYSSAAAGGVATPVPS
ncbi:MAG TPA: Gfo/Idh/MocA family oxidoreductase [Candidatus Binatia bacterium]|nr:Gfo/Idh/MocA family oxidoreductase [Candidatus Binatia bacterium]